MNILTALKNSVNYPLSDNNVTSVLIGRGLDGTDDFGMEIAQSRAYRLAYADVLRFVVTMVNLSQGGSVSQAAVAELRGTANSIYRQYDEPVIGETADSISTLTDVSNLW